MALGVFFFRLKMTANNDIVSRMLIELSKDDQLHVIRHNTTYAQQATSSRRGWAYKTELSHRRIEVGPEEERHPAAYGCWNHDSEVYAFGQRLGENFDEKKLHAAFVQRAIHDFLMSQSTLLQVATSLGVRDLIQSVGEKQAEMFVLDFIIPQLVGRDVTEMWDLPNPMGLLSAMLKSAGRGEPEPRILWASGKNTLMPVYNVGIYVDKKLIGKSPGESAIIAEDMAAREALKNLMNVADSRQPLLLGDRLREVTLDYERTANDY
ncbi:RM44-like protein [Mya arenaria]|uniref:RM44-like protein n=1 Tax=Mya arenaria TaxID=6604 RepID=A0ABY7E3A0_MYAAR|nr:RM44-like protein [Mya arenaria]